MTGVQTCTLPISAQRLIICYDGDEPGQNAIADALKLVKERPFEIGVVMLPDGQDPDEYIKAHGAEAFQQQLEGHVLTPVAFELQRLAGQYNFSVDNERLAYVQSALETLVTIESTVEQDLYLRQVADQANVDLTALKTEFTNAARQYQRKERAKKRQTRLTTQQTSSAPPILNVVLNRTEISERRLLNLAIGDPTLCQQLLDQADFAFNNPQLQTLFENWQQYLQTNGQHDVAGFADFLTPDQQPLLMEVEMMPLPDEISDAEINDYIHNIQTAHLDQRLKNAQQQVKRAAEQGDGDAEMKWLNELLQLKRQLSQ